MPRKLSPPAGSPPVASVLVVDDSVVQRNRNQAVAPCRELGAAMACEAASGGEALHLIEMLVLRDAFDEMRRPSDVQARSDADGAGEPTTTAPAFPR